MLKKIGYIPVHSPAAAAGEDNLLGSECSYKYLSFVTLGIRCTFLLLVDFLTVFPILIIEDQI